MKVCGFMRSTVVHKNKGGMEIHGQMLSEGFVKRGHEVGILTTRHPQNKEYEERKRVKTYYLKHSIPGCYSKRWWIESIKKFEELNKHEKFDIIWSQSAGGYYYAKRLRDKYDIPIVSTIHGIAFGEIKSAFNSIHNIKTVFEFLFKTFPKNTFCHLTVDNILLKKSDAIIGVSDEVAEAIKKYHLINSRKIRVVYNGVDLLRFIPSLEYRKKIRKKFGISDKEKVILLLGVISRQKGFHLAIQALPKVLKWVKDLKLLVVGNGPCLPDLKRVAKRLKVKQNVIFCGFVPHEGTPEYYNACDLYIIPTLRVEGFPLTVAEAMACQKPMIASKIGGIPSAIDDGENGILIPPGNIDVLAGKIIEILKNREFARKLATNAREKAVRKFSTEKMVNDTIKVFEACLAEREQFSSAKAQF